MSTSANIRVTANHSARTFTIRFQDDNGKTYKKFRTIPMTRDEFNSELYNTENDWKQFLKSSDYYEVK